MAAPSTGRPRVRRPAEPPVRVIFRPELVARILAGDKTQTRRLVRAGQPGRYRVDRTYAVQPGRTRHGVARIRVTGVRRERLAEITGDDARREGFGSVAEFFAYWDDLHGPAAPAGSRDVEVWVISFLLEPAPAHVGRDGSVEAHDPGAEASGPAARSAIP